MKPETFKIRCSAIGQIMTEARSKSEPLSETTKAYLIEWYISAKYGRTKDVSNQYIRKGLMVEEDAISLLSVIDKVVYVKNELHYSNDVLTGTPDIVTDTEVIDVKSSWDLWTFTKARTNAITKAYWWQVQGYMALTGRTSARVAHCLVNTPPLLVEDAKRKLAWQIGTDRHDLQDALDAVEREMTFDDIPKRERVHVFTVERDDAAIAAISARVDECRNFLAALS